LEEDIEEERFFYKKLMVSLLREGSKVIMYGQLCLSKFLEEVENEVYVLLSTLERMCHGLKCHPSQTIFAPPCLVLSRSSAEFGVGP
jgi:hypothetical protein